MSSLSNRMEKSEAQRRMRQHRVASQGDRRMRTHRGASQSDRRPYDADDADDADGNDGEDGETTVTMGLTYVAGTPLTVEVGNRRDSAGDDEQGQQQHPTPPVCCAFQDASQAVRVALDMMRLAAIWDLHSGDGQVVDPGVGDTQELVVSLLQRVAHDLVAEPGDDVERYMSMLARQRGLRNKRGRSSPKRVRPRRRV